MQIDKRREEIWDLGKLKQIITKTSEREKQAQNVEWLRGILNESTAEKIKEVISTEKSTIKFWCMF